MTKLILIRHAHVDTGPAPGRLCGSLDLPLSPSGLAQVGALRERGDRLHRPVALYTSDLVRARAVADALASIWETRARQDSALREICCGTLEGVGIEDIQRSHPALWAQNEAQSDDAFTWPGGESYRGFRARVLLALRRIAAAHRGGAVAVVTHSGVITQVLGTVRRRSAAIWRADRAEPLTATEVSWEHGSPRAILSFNCRDWR